MDNKLGDLLNLYQEILNISKRIVDITHKPDEEGLWMTDFTQLVEKRELLIEEIESKQALSLISAETSEKIKEIIRQIQGFDKEVADLVQKEMAYIRGKIGNVRQNAKAQSAYLGNDNQADGWFFDSRE